MAWFSSEETDALREKVSELQEQLTESKDKSQRIRDLEKECEKERNQRLELEYELKHGAMVHQLKSAIELIEFTKSENDKQRSLIAKLAEAMVRKENY